VEGKRRGYWGKREYSTVVSLSTSCSTREIKEWRVVYILKLHPFPSEKDNFGGINKKKREYKKKT